MPSAAPLAIYYLVFFFAFGSFWPYFSLFLENAGLPPAEITTLFAIFPVMNVVGPPLCGLAADTWRARGLLQRLLSVAQAIAFGGFFLVGSSRLALAAVTALFGLLRSPIGTLADASTLEHVRRHGGSFGRVRLWGSVGFLMAVLVSGRVLDRYGIGMVMRVALGCLGALAVVSFTIPAAPPRPNPLALREWLGMLQKRELWVFLAAVLLSVLGAACYDSAFALHVKRLGYPGQFIGLALATGVLAEVGLMAVSARMLERVGVERVFALAVATGALRWLLMAHVTTELGILALQPLHGMTFGMLLVSGVTIMRQRATADTVTAAQGLFWAAYAVGGVVGYPLAGRLFERSAATMFHASAAISLLACACALAYARLRSMAEAREGQAGEAVNLAGS